MIRKLETSVPKVKISTRSKLKEQLIHHPKSESLGSVNKFAFPFISNEKTEIPALADANKSMKGMTKSKAKIPENIALKYQEKLAKVMKTNLSSIKYKEFISRNTHEYCINSTYNQLLKSFNEFILLTNDRIDNREDVNILME